VSPEYLRQHIDEMVAVTIDDLVSDFLLLPRGPNYIEYAEFRDAYEILRRTTEVFGQFDAATVLAALKLNSRAFGVLRAILGMTPPEWADLTREDVGSDVTQGSARQLDRACRANPDYFATAAPVSKTRIEAMVSVAVQLIRKGVPDGQEGVVHRLAKVDTMAGLESLQYVAHEDVSYSMLLYERYLGRPFAAHRDAVSDLIGEVMETAVEDQLRQNEVGYRKTKRAERIPGFGQAPDFCIPDEHSPGVVIEAKITSDDGTARDKVTRIRRLATQRDEHVQAGRPTYQVIACIDGRGFRERRADMRQMLLALDGMVFTTATLDRLVSSSRLRDYAVSG
jgi:hypothetical protein